MNAKLFVSKPWFFEAILKLTPEPWIQSEYKSVQKLIDRLHRKNPPTGSRSTKKVWFQVLAKFVKKCNMSPDELIKLSKREIEEKIQAFCDEYAVRGKAALARNSAAILNAFFKVNGVKDLELETYKYVEAGKEYVPTKEDVYRMADFAPSLRDRAIILCLFQSGLRNSTLRALTYGMLKDQIESGKTPIRVHVTSELRKYDPDACKEGVNYWTFFGAEASEALRNYIFDRKNRLGEIKDEEPLFLLEAKNLAKLHPHKIGKCMSKMALWSVVKKCAKRAGIKEWKQIRVHSLRKSFRSILDRGYVDGGQMPEDDKEYLMGHTLPGAKKPYHTANVQELEERYMRLDWSPSIPDVVELVKLEQQFKEKTGKEPNEAYIAANIPLTDTRKKLSLMRLAVMKLETKKGEHEFKSLMPPLRTEPNGCKIQVVTVGFDELDRYLEEGYEIVATNGDRYKLVKS
jgi:integrase